MAAPPALPEKIFIYINKEARKTVNLLECGCRICYNFFMLSGKRNSRLPLFAAAAFLIFFTLFELFLRISGFNYVPYPHNSFGKFAELFSIKHNSFNMPDLELIWKLSPGTVISQNSIKINRKGIRGKERPYGKPPGTSRVLIIGNSTVFGWGLPDSQIFTNILEQKLNAAGGSPRYEVINGGVPAYSSFQSLRFFKKELIRYDPDIIVVCSKFSDCFCSYYDDKSVMASGKNYFIKKLLYLSRTYHFLRQAVWTLRSLNADFSKLPKRHRSTIADYTGNLQEFINISKSINARVMFLSFDRPEKNNITTPLSPYALNLIKISQKNIGADASRGEAIEKVYLSNKHLGILKIAREAYKAENRAADCSRVEQIMMNLNPWFYDLEAYENAMRKTADYNGIGLIDISGIYKQQPNRNALFIDEVHPGFTGHMLIAEALYKALTGDGPSVAGE